METDLSSVVTIGLCVRNSEKTIGQCVESIVNLDYPKNSFRLFVVDGCSTDDTPRIIKGKLAGSGVKFAFMSDGGRGLSVARQMVVDACSSKYVVWIDGDNVLPPNFLKSQVDYMEKHEETGFCVVKMIPLGESLVARLQGYQLGIPASDWEKAGFLMGKVGMQGTVCRVNAIKNAGEFDSSMNGAGEDVDLFIRIRIAGWAIGSNNETSIHHYMRDTWRSLWKESVWLGYGAHYLITKHMSFFPSLSRRAGFAVLDCARLTFKSFKLTKDLGCILMPFHYGLRRVGFLVGHYYARRDGYGQSYK